MNRFIAAWKALRGTLEPEIVIADTAVVRTVYTTGGYYGYGWGSAPKHYATCQQAHEESPGAEVKAHKTLFIGGKHYWMPYDLRVATLQPKPKRPKGSRA
jgi:hypothetical protein